MNNAIFNGLVLAAPQLRHTTDNLQIAETTIEVMDTQQEPKPFALKVLVFGEKAKDFAENVKEGDRILVVGTLKMNTIDRTEGFKEKRGELIVSQWNKDANVINIVGRVGGEVQVQYFESGAVVAKFTLAVNRPKSGDEPDWFNIEVWGRTAEVAGNYARKGSLIGITGSLKLETWTDRSTGADRSRPVIKGDRLHLLGSRNDREEVAEEDTPVSLPLAANPSPSASPKTVRAKSDAGRSQEQVKDEDWDAIPF